jgi:tetratricopeptide (TPR) repeat protein
MKRSQPIPIVLLAVFLWGADSPDLQDRLAQHRNLGKAFSENPTTQAQAVLEFKKALALAPNSNREKLNYGLALLRAGKTSAGVACLQEVQRNDPKLPHTWLNLGIYYKKNGDTAQAIRQFERMETLVPGEPIVHYQLGTLLNSPGATGTRRRSSNRQPAWTRVSPPPAFSFTTCTVRLAGRRTRLRLSGFSKS